jgi:hypothetical protein
MLNGEKLKAFPLKSVPKQECLLFPFLINIMYEFLARVIRPEKKIKGKTRNEVKIYQFSDNMILYLKDPKYSARKFLDLINTFSKVVEHKLNVQKLLFCMTIIIGTERNQAEK